MGSCCSSNYESKCGYLYTSVIGKMKPMDLILFRSRDPGSAMITKIEQRGNKNAHAGDFTHAGMVVTSDILDDPLLEPHKMYVIESVISGPLGYGVKNIKNKSFLGVQIRDLEAIINAYDEQNTTAIAWCPLINPIKINEETKAKFTAFYKEVDGKIWTLNPWTMFASVFACMRPCREAIETVTFTGDWMFCSELVAHLYKKMGIFGEKVNPKDVIPGDFVYPEEDTDQMPLVIEKIVYIVTLNHYSKIFSDKTHSEIQLNHKVDDTAIIIKSPSKTKKHKSHHAEKMEIEEIKLDKIEME